MTKQKDKQIREQYQEKAQEVLERKPKDKTLSSKRVILRRWKGDKTPIYVEEEVKDFIKKEEDLIENDFMMRIIARVSAGVTDLDLIRDLIKQDFKYLKAERFKLIGDALIHSPLRKSNSVEDTPEEGVTREGPKAKTSGTHSQQENSAKSSIRFIHPAGTSKRKTLALGWEDGAHDKIIELADKADKQSDVYHNEVVKRFKESSGNARCANCGKPSYNHLTEDGRRSSKGIYCDNTKTKTFEMKDPLDAIFVDKHKTTDNQETCANSEGYSKDMWGKYTLKPKTTDNQGCGKEYEVWLYNKGGVPEKIENEVCGDVGLCLSCDNQGCQNCYRSRVDCERDGCGKFTTDKTDCTKCKCGHSELNHNQGSIKDACFICSCKKFTKDNPKGCGKMFLAAGCGGQIGFNLLCEKGQLCPGCGNQNCKNLKGGNQNGNK